MDFVVRLTVPGLSGGQRKSKPPREEITSSRAFSRADEKRRALPGATAFRSTCSWLLLAFCQLALAARGDLWTTAYYPGWEQAAMPAAQIDFAAVTHVIHFSLVPNDDGSLNASANSLSIGNSAAIVNAAHAAGRQVLVCVGGAGSSFQAATLPVHLPSFINNLTDFMAVRGYDGIDLDWEPLTAADTTQFTNLVIGLRAALDAFPSAKMLTVAVPAYSSYGDPATTVPDIFASVQDRFDQINLMTYDLAGPYGGWVTWFNSPIYDGGFRFPSTGGLVPSVDGAVNGFVSRGIPAAKLGIGIAFYGYVWSGGAGTPTGGAAFPRQAWTTAPSTAARSFNDIQAAYAQAGVYHWDDSAQAAYLSLDRTGSTDDRFISYDDQRTCQAKVSYARNRGLGGVMIWELAQDHTAGEPDPLLQAIKQALATPGPTTIQLNGSNVVLTFTGLPLGSYRVQWTTNLASPGWNTLLVTNMLGVGGPVNVSDSEALVRSASTFYRIQTPP